MDKSMDKRVYGVLGISSIMANWNADFSGFPKTISDGRTFGSDKALKYPMKKMWNDEGKKVIYIKSLCVQDGTKQSKVLLPRTLKERYEYVYAVNDLSKTTDSKEVLKNLFQAVDIKNFGATFAEAGNNISITGAVQIGQGFNKYEDTMPQEQPILSPFRDPNAKEKNQRTAKEGEEADDAKNSTIGTKIVSDEAHYFYPFAINPQAYKEYVEMEVTDGYTDEDYAQFKRTALVSTTSYATNAKIGCENEFALFIETKPEVYLPNLSPYITFSKGDGKNEIQVLCGDLLDHYTDCILSTEIYYNPYTTKLIGNLPGAKIFNILTQKEV